MGTSGTLMSLAAQSQGLNANFLNAAYAVAWLGQRIPRYTTSDFALLPFQPVSSPQPPTEQETWRSTAQAYHTDLNCHPANVDIRPLGYTFDNGKGCSVSGIVLSPATFDFEFMVLYIGYYDNAILDWSLQNPNCTAEHANNFLALWAARESQIRSGIYSNLTALFCEPRYYIQEGNITIDSSNGTVLTNTTDSFLNTTLSVNDTFNTTQFEYLLGVGIQPVVERADFPDTALVEQFPQLLRYNLTWPVSNMVGFAVALTPHPVANLFSADLLSDAFQRAHRLLLSVAFSTLTQPLSSNNLSDIRSGLRQDTLGAIIMVRTISIVVETGLALIILLSTILWYYSGKRASHLQQDPASIADIMSAVRLGSLSKSLKDDGTLSTEALTKELSNKVFYLSSSNDQGHMIPNLEEKNCSDPNSVDHQTSRQNSVDNSFSPVLPKELSFWVGMALVTIIMFAIIGVAFLQVWSARQNGKLLIF